VDLSITIASCENVVWLTVINPLLTSELKEDSVNYIFTLPLACINIREEQRGLRFLENRVLRKIFGHMMEDIRMLEKTA